MDFSGKTYPLSSKHILWNKNTNKGDNPSNKSSMSDFISFFKISWISDTLR